MSSVCADRPQNCWQIRCSLPNDCVTKYVTGCQIVASCFSCEPFVGKLCVQTAWSRLSDVASSNSLTLWKTQCLAWVFYCCCFILMLAAYLFVSLHSLLTHRCLIFMICLSICVSISLSCYHNRSASGWLRFMFFVGLNTAMNVLAKSLLNMPGSLIIFQRTIFIMFKVNDCRILIIPRSVSLGTCQTCEKKKCRWISEHAEIPSLSLWNEMGVCGWQKGIVRSLAFSLD